MSKSVPIVVRLYRLYFRVMGVFLKRIAAQQLVQLFSSPRQKVSRKKEEEVLAIATKKRVKAEGMNLQVYEWGKGEKLAILFHGWESNAGSLGAFVSPLTESNYKVITYDAPAHGKSGGKRANLIYFKKAAKAIIETYKVPELVVGHSLGANTIIMTAFEEQYNFKKVVLIAPVNRLMNVFEEMRSILQLSDSLFMAFIRLFERQAGYTFEDFYFHKFGKQSQLRNILLFHDVGDRITNFSHAEKMNENWNETHLHSIKGSGHYKILWNEEVLNLSMKYIKE